MQQTITTRKRLFTLVLSCFSSVFGYFVGYVFSLALYSCSLLQLPSIVCWFCLWLVFMSSYFRFFLSFNNLFGFIVCFVRSFSLSVNLSFCLSSVCSFVRHFVISVRMLLLLSVLRSFSIYLYFRSHRLPFSMFLPSGFSGYVFLSVIACFPSLLLSIFLSGFLLASGLRLRLLRSSATTRSDEPRALQKCGKLPVAGSLIWGNSPRISQLASQTPCPCCSTELPTKVCRSLPRREQKHNNAVPGVSILGNAACCLQPFSYVAE